MVGDRAVGRETGNSHLQRFARDPLTVAVDAEMQQISENCRRGREPLDFDKKSAPDVAGFSLQAAQHKCGEASHTAFGANSFHGPNGCATNAPSMQWRCMKFLR
ncbi:MAG: hypothetical protein WCA24_05105 [Thiomonas sp.]